MLGVDEVLKQDGAIMLSSMSSQANGRVHYD